MAPFLALALVLAPGRGGYGRMRTGRGLGRSAVDLPVLTLVPVASDEMQQRPVYMGETWWRWRLLWW